MTNQKSPQDPRRPKFKVSQGGRLELCSNDITVGIDLSIDEALSLALLVLYETRERASVQAALCKQQVGEGS